MPRPWNPRLQLDPELWLKPQVVQIGAAAGLDRWAVVGKLLLVWYHAQVKATDAGVLEGKSAAWVNALVECPGFAEAMAAAGWLAIEPGGVRIPDFDAFISKRAVRRIEKGDWQADRRVRTTDPEPPLRTECGPYEGGMKPYSAGTIAPSPPPPAPPAKAKGGRRKGPPPAGGPLWDRFWAAYPRKEKRVEALWAWHGLGAEATEQLLVKILTALEWQARSEQWRGSVRFIPLPGSYLNGRRWEDEPGRTGRPGGDVRSGARVIDTEGRYGRKPKFGDPTPAPTEDEPPAPGSLF